VVAGDTSASRSDVAPLTLCYFVAVTGEYVLEGLTPLQGLRVGIYRPVSSRIASNGD
jgi:hypothetical protein